MKEHFRELISNRNRKITFRSFLGLNGPRRTVCPRWNDSTGWYDGVDRITEEMRKSGQLYCDPTNLDNRTSNFTLCHKTDKGGDCVLDLSNDGDYLIAKWLFESYDDVVAVSNRPGMHTATHQFYVFNEEIELQEDSQHYERRFEAQGIVRDMSVDTLYSCARLLGYRMEKKRPQEIRVFLYKLIDDPKTGRDVIAKVKKIADEIDNGLADLKIWAYEKIDSNIITKKQDGSYWYGEHKLGFDFPDLVDTLKKKTMGDLVVRMDNDFEEQGRIRPSEVVAYKRPGKKEEKGEGEEEVVVVDRQPARPKTVARKKQ